MMGRNKVAAVMLLSAFSVAACSNSGSDMQSSTQTSSTTTAAIIGVSVSPPPSQVNGSRRPVQFDPCTQIGDSTIAAAGYDPKTRKRADQVHDSYAAIGCTFQRIPQKADGEDVSVGSLTVLSTNVTLDEFKKRDSGKAVQVSVGGLDGIQTPQPDAESCYIDVTGPDGVLVISTSTTAALSSDNPCDLVKMAAPKIVAAVGKR